MEVRDIVQETGIKTISKKKKCKKARWLSEEALQIAVKRREVKSKGEKKISSEYSLEKLMLKLKLQYFGHLMQRIVSLEKTLMLGKIEGRITEDETVEWHHQFYGYEFQQTLGDGEGQRNLACCSPWGCRESNTTERLDDNKGCMEVLATQLCLTLRPHGL